jgi:hypothetical protein
LTRFLSPLAVLVDDLFRLRPFPNEAARLPLKFLTGIMDSFDLPCTVFSTDDA